MKKFKRFLCIPLLVLFAMTLLTLPVAAAVKVLLPDGNPAASMTFTLRAGQVGAPTKVGPLQVTTDAQGVFAYPAGMKGIANGSLDLSTTSPSNMRGHTEFMSKDTMYDWPIQVNLKPF